MKLYLSEMTSISIEYFYACYERGSVYFIPPLGKLYIKLRYRCYVKVVKLVESGFFEVTVTLENNIFYPVAWHGLSELYIDPRDWYERRVTYYLPSSPLSSARGVEF